MGFSGAEAQGAEDACDIRTVDGMQHGFRKHLPIDQPLGQEDAGHIRLGLFQAAVQPSHGFANIHLLAIDMRVCGPEPMRDLMQDGGGQIAVCGDIVDLCGSEHLPGDGQDDLADARIHEVLEENLLGAIFCMNSRIVGQIVRYRLVAVTQVARAERRIGDLHRRGLAPL